MYYLTNNSSVVWKVQSYGLNCLKDLMSQNFIPHNPNQWFNNIMIILLMKETKLLIPTKQVSPMRQIYSCSTCDNFIIICKSSKSYSTFQYPGDGFAECDCLICHT